MPINVAATLSGLNTLSVRLDAAMEDVVKDVLEHVQQFAKARAGTFLGDYPERSTTLPGTLRDSIVTEGPREQERGVYQGATGPLVVYGAQREFGGWIYPKPDNPQGMQFYFEGRVWKRVKKVYQEIYPTGRYLSPAARDTIPLAEGITIKHLSAAILERNYG